MAKFRTTALVLSAVMLVGSGAALVGAAGPQGAAPWARGAGSPPVRLKAGAVYPQDRYQAHPSGAQQGNQPGLYVVQLKGPVRDEQKRALTARGVELGDYLPEYAFLARMSDATARSLSGLGFVGGVAPYLPEQKVAPALRQAKGEVPVRIATFGQRGPALQRQAQDLGARNLSGGPGVLTARLLAERIGELARSADVVYVEPMRRPVLFNDVAGGIIGARVANQSGLTGEGQVVAVADTGLDTGRESDLHPDFRGRLQQLFRLGKGDAADSHGHGTHVAGSVVGTGAAGDGSVRGMAPGARLVFQAVGDAQGGLGGIPDDLNVLFDQARQAGAHIHSNSWGVSAASGGAGAYDSQARMVDQYMWEHDLTILFAAGNDGDSNQDGRPDYGTVSTPGTAKNAITVGASQNNRPDRGKHAQDPGRLASFSSRGLTGDGRVKPDVVAPGTWILSTRSSRAPQENYWAVQDGHYAYMGGTSMATPITAGAAAVVRQHLSLRLQAAPKPSLLKAALIDGAATLPESGYRDQGWGRVDVGASAGQGERKVLLDNETTALSTGQSTALRYQVAAGQPLKVTLVWTDFPGSVAASKALVNDLDLSVTSPDGKVLVGNHMLGNSGPDRSNNVEQVLVASPAAGTYTVRVNAHNVPQGPQRFALVVSGPATEAAPGPEPPADTTPPTVRLTQPAGGAVLSGQATVSASASDNQGVARVEFFIGSYLLKSLAVPPYQAPWDTTSAPDGSHTVRAVAYDQAGNKSEDKVQVAVKNRGPQPPPEGDPRLTQVFTGTAGRFGSYRTHYLEVRQPGPVALSLEWSGPATLALALYDQRGGLLGRTQGGSPAQATVTVKEPGTYGLVVVNSGQPWQLGTTVYTATAAVPSTGLVRTSHQGAVSALGPSRVRHRLTVPAAGAVNLSLRYSGRADLDLYVYDQYGLPMASSTSPNLNPETLSLRLGPGSFSAEVVADSGAADYSLEVIAPAGKD